MATQEQINQAIAEFQQELNTLAHDPDVIRAINASLYDTCPDCGNSKPTASARCFTCTAHLIAAPLDN